MLLDRLCRHILALSMKRTQSWGPLSGSSWSEQYQIYDHMQVNRSLVRFTAAKICTSVVEIPDTKVSFDIDYDVAAFLFFFSRVHNSSTSFGMSTLCLAMNSGQRCSGSELP